MDPLTAITSIVDYRTKKKDEIRQLLLKTALVDQEKSAIAWKMLQAEEEAATQLRSDISKLIQTRIRTAAQVEDAVLGGRSSVEAQSIAAAAGIRKAQIQSSTDLQVAQLKHQESVEAAVKREEDAASGITGQIFSATSGLGGLSPSGSPANAIDQAWRTVAPAIAALPSEYARNLATADFFNRAVTNMTNGSADKPSQWKTTDAAKAVAAQLSSHGFDPSTYLPSSLSMQRTAAVQKATAAAGDVVTGVPGGSASGGSQEFRQMAGPEAISRAAKIGVEEAALPAAEAQAALSKLRLEDPQSVAGMDLQAFIAATRDPNSVQGKAFAAMQVAPWDTVAAFNDPFVVSQLKKLAEYDRSSAARKASMTDTKIPTPVQLEDQARIAYTQLYGTQKMQDLLYPSAAMVKPTEPITTAQQQQPPEKQEAPRLQPVADIPLPEDTQQAEYQPEQQPPEVTAAAQQQQPETPEDITFKPMEEGEITQDSYGELRNILESGKDYGSLSADEQKSVADELARASQRRLDIHKEQEALPDGPERDKLSEEAMDIDTLLHKAIALNPQDFDTEGAPDYVREFAQASKPKTPMEVVAKTDAASTVKGIDLATQVAMADPPDTVGEWKTVIAKQYGESKLLPTEYRAIFDYARRGKIPPDMQTIRMDLYNLLGERRWRQMQVSDQAVTFFAAVRALQSAGTLPDLKE